MTKRRILSALVLGSAILGIISIALHKAIDGPGIPPWVTTVQYIVYGVGGLAGAYGLLTTAHAGEKQPPDPRS